MINDTFGMGFGGGFMWAFWLLIIGLVAWLLIGLFNAGRSSLSPGSSSRASSALDILKERYARGEIDSEEFKQKKAELTKN